MVRIATVNDAEQLNILNNEFNGEGASIDNIGNSLVSNKQEVVIVADEDDILVGFVCVQLKKSFCYDEYMPEITCSRVWAIGPSVAATTRISACGIRSGTNNPPSGASPACTASRSEKARAHALSFVL